jgi:hypothetical protein
MKGIDIQIDKQRLIFTNYLFAGNICSWNGRCQTNYRNDKAVPECLNAGTLNYADVTLDDTKDVISFFDVLPQRTIDKAEVDIYFAVKLTKLFPSVTERATEYVLNAIALNLIQGQTFDIENITEGYESWKQWSNVKKEDNMHPFYLFKIKTKTQYSLTC